MVRTINRSAAFYHKSKQGPSLLCIQANEVRLIKKSPEIYRLIRQSERDVCKPKKFTVVNNLYKQQVRGNESCRDFNFYKEKLKIKLLKRYRMQRETFTTVHWVKRLCLLARKPGDFFMKSATIPQKAPHYAGL